VDPAGIVFSKTATNHLVTSGDNVPLTVPIMTQRTTQAVRIPAKGLKPYLNKKAYKLLGKSFINVVSKPPVEFMKTDKKMPRESGICKDEKTTRKTGGLI
jgi:hypothetical protein